MIEASKRDNLALIGALYIYYLLYFHKNKKNEVRRSLIDSNNNINAIILAYASKLGFKVCCTNVGAWKINNSTFKIFEIVLASF